VNQWEALNRYTQDPILSIDNNLAERTLRMVALGRKNWLFAGSERGAQRAAVIYSLVASCKLCGHDPYAYFRDVLSRISTHPSSRIDELLPSHWVKPASD
jgi:transposase